MYRTGISAAVLRELLLHLEFRVVALYYNTFFFFFLRTREFQSRTRIHIYNTQPRRSSS